MCIRDSTYFVKSNHVLQPNGFELIGLQHKNGIVESTVRKQPTDTNNFLLQKLIDQTELIAFEEVLPSMNDIFIKTVSR